MLRVRNGTVAGLEILLGYGDFGMATQKIPF
jgi:hypothetical protein